MTDLSTAGKRWALAALYVLLVFTLQPLLLDHTFAAGSSHEHSDQDACAWLDHAASAGLHSSAPPLSLVQIITSVSSISRYDDVPPPAPNTVARPTTLGACQVRLHESMLLEPMTWRASFCAR